MKKAGRKKPGPKKGWKLKGVRKATEQKRASGLKRAAKRTVRAKRSTSSWPMWYREAAKHSKGLLVEVGRGKAVRIQAIKIS